VNAEIDDVFKTPPGDGIASLPKGAGIYGMWNRVTRLWNIGQSENIQRRCLLHRSQLRAGTAGNLRIRRDVENHGADTFFFLVLKEVTVTPGVNLKHQLNQLEVWWVLQFQAHDERYGYNSEAGRCRTMGSRFRDREKKLMRYNSDKYRLLPGVDLCDPINHLLLASWVPGS
jgi:hypothetical protein